MDSQSVENYTFFSNFEDWQLLPKYVRENIIGNTRIAVLCAFFQLETYLHRATLNPSQANQHTTHSAVSGDSASNPSLPPSPLNYTAQHGGQSQSAFRR